jgi:hypothetical protein
MQVTNEQIIIDLNKLYEEIREMIPIYGNSITGMAISDISQKLAKAIAKIERAEHAKT